MTATMKTNSKSKVRKAGSRLRQSVLRFGVLLSVTSMLLSLAMANAVSASAFYESYNAKWNQGGGADAADSCACNCNCDCDATPFPAATYTERVWTTLVYFATTFEVLARGFSLGFGARMLLYFFLDHGQPETTTTEVLYDQIKRRVIVSTIAGVSAAAFIHGSSLFVPTQLRDNWFSYKTQ